MSKSLPRWVEEAAKKEALTHVYCVRDAMEEVFLLGASLVLERLEKTRECDQLDYSCEVTHAINTGREEIRKEVLDD